MGHWRALVVPGTVRCLLVLDTCVLVAVMIIDGRLGDTWGRRRVSLLGMVVYGTGSALVAQSYRGRERAVAYGVIGGLAGAGIAVGPLLGGRVTTYLTWRLVFAGEVVVVVVAVLIFREAIAEAAHRGPRPRLDVFGAVLSAAGPGALGELSRQARHETSVAVESGISFVSTDHVRSAAEGAVLPPDEVDALTASYASARLDGLKAAIPAGGGSTLASFLVTPGLPADRTGRARQPDAGAPTEAVGQAC